MDFLKSLIADANWLTALGGLIGVIATAYFAKGKTASLSKPTPVSNAPLSSMTCGWSEQERVTLSHIADQVHQLTIDMAILKDRNPRDRER